MEISLTQTLEIILRNKFFCSSLIILKIELYYTLKEQHE
jgi:hypothetical protein